MRSNATPMEALIAEMLGDVGKLHEAVGALRQDLAELDVQSKQRIDAYAKQAVESAAGLRQSSGSEGGMSDEIAADAMAEILIGMRMAIDRMDLSTQANESIKQEIAKLVANPGRAILTDRPDLKGALVVAPLAADGVSSQIAASRKVAAPLAKAIKKTPSGWATAVAKAIRDASLFIGDMVGGLLRKNQLSPELTGAVILGATVGGIVVGMISAYLLR